MRHHKTMTDETNIINLERAVDVLLARQLGLTPERIRELIASVRLAPIFGVTDDDAEILARRLETRHDITMNLGAVLTKRDYKPWLESALAEIDFYYWERYRQLLESKQMPAQVIATLHEDTTRTLRLLENPSKEGPWSRRGMVVGHVQSGKTANYIGLICKAADAGYRLIASDRWRAQISGAIRPRSASTRVSSVVTAPAFSLSARRASSASAVLTRAGAP